MIKYLSTAVAAGALAFSVAQSSAVQIDGSASFTGLNNVTVDNTSFPSVTSLTFTGNPNAQVTGGLGGLGSYTGSPATFFSFVIASASGNTLWSILGGPSFVMSSASNSSGNNDALVVTGAGTISGGGWTSTPGTFTLVAPRSAGTDPALLEFSFSAFSSAFPDNNNVPDGGATAALLGAGLLGIGAASRMRRQ